MRSATSAFCFVVLQILWIFRLIYDTILPEKSVNNEVSSNSLTDDNSAETEKRHLIHLFTTSPKHINKRPICYMHVCEIILPHAEEMLRCACAKGFPSVNYERQSYSEEEALFVSPDRVPGQISNVWIESFSLVA